MTNERKITWIASFSHFFTHSYMTLLPAVLVVITSEQSISFMDIGLIANIGYFLYGLGSIPAGILADRLGSKRVLTLGVLGMSFSSLLVGISVGSFFFAITYALLGLFSSFYHPAGLSLIGRHIKVKGKVLGIHGVLGNLGLILAPLTASLCIMFFGSWRAAYILYGLFGLVLGLVIYVARVEEEQDLSLRDMLPGKRKAVNEGGMTTEQRDPSHRPKGEKTSDVFPFALGVLYLGSMLSGLIFRGSLTFFPTLFQREVNFIASHDTPVALAGTMTTAILSFGLVGAWFGGYINDKIKRPELFPAIVFVLVTPALYCISRFTDSWLIAASAFFSLVYYTWQPSQNYLIAKYTRKASHGRSFGVNFFLIFGMGSIATAVGGYAADNFGVDFFYRLMAYVSLAALLAALMVLVVRPYQVRWQVVKE